MRCTKERVIFKFHRRFPWFYSGAGYSKFLLSRGSGKRFFNDVHQESRRRSLNAIVKTTTSNLARFIERPCPQFCSFARKEGGGKKGGKGISRKHVPTQNRGRLNAGDIVAGIERGDLAVSAVHRSLISSFTSEHWQEEKSQKGL